MSYLRLCLPLMLLAAGAVQSAAQQNTSARLLLEADQARAGSTILAAIELKMAPGWHTYWKNPGESGMPTTVDWTLPEGVTAGEIRWPVPDLYVSEGLTTYVLHDTALLLVPLTLADSLPSGPLAIQARVDWLECEKLCLPGNATIRANVAIGPEPRPSQHAARIQEAARKLPGEAPPGLAQARWEDASEGESRTLRLELNVPLAPGAVEFFPYGGEGFAFTGLVDKALAGDRVVLRQTVESMSGKWPERIDGLVVTRSPAGDTDAMEILGVEVVVPGIRAVAGSLWLMLGAAFIGGLILNIMPCVMPVIALKILGFVQQSKEEPGRVRTLGLMYGVGVLCSFLTLAAVAIAVQQAGGLADWGMQFQNTQFLVAITVLVTLVALNLFGVFEINLGGRAMGAAGTLASKEGLSGAFFNGVLATALATPCSAPFLGAALGFAFAQPPATILLMFLMIGAGLAFPYVLLSFNPRWLKFLPKPGRWMERFKVGMGFPMLATAIWLFWLASGHFGSDGALWLGLFLVVLALGAWVWGEFVQRGRTARGWAMVTAAVLVGFGYVYALERQLSWRAPVLIAGSGMTGRVPGGIAWEPWSSEAVAAARSAGNPVIVDFTARWCLTCQVNKKTSLEIPSVRAKIEELGAVAFLADYTLKDPAITAELRRHGRGGVPLVVVYPPDPAAQGMVLSEVLTPGMVLSALDKAAAATPSRLAGQSSSLAGDSKR